MPDPKLLDRATQLACVLFSQDDDLLREAKRRQDSGEAFGGVIYVHQRRLQLDVYGHWIDDLELIARATETAEFINRVQYLPL